MGGWHGRSVPVRACQLTLSWAASEPWRPCPGPIMRLHDKCLLVFLGLAVTACGQHSDQGAAAGTPFSRQQVDSMADIQAPLLDSAAAHAAHAARRECQALTLLAFGFRPAPVADSLVADRTGCLECRRTPGSRGVRAGARGTVRDEVAATASRAPVPQPLPPPMSVDR